MGTRGVPGTHGSLDHHVRHPQILRLLVLYLNGTRLNGRHTEFEIHNTSPGNGTYIHMEGVEGSNDPGGPGSPEGLGGLAFLESNFGS